MKEENIKLDILKIIIALIIFVISIINIMPYRINKVLYIVAFLISGYEVIIKAIKNIFKGKVFDENFLMTIATIGAFAINKPQEAIAVMIFYNIGEIFEDLATNKSKKSITELMNIKPKTANLKVDNQIEIVEPETLKVGDIIIVKPGEKIPVDGIVVFGESQINTSALTGEVFPKSVDVNSKVLAGCINETNLIEVKVTKEFINTEINKIIELVKNASKTKSKTEQFITKFAKIYTPIVVGLAIIIAFIIPMASGFKELSEWIRRALVFLVTSCPCAIVISIPLGYFAGIRKSRKRRHFNKRI